MKIFNDSFYKAKCSISIIERKSFNYVNDSKRSNLSVMKNVGLMKHNN